jgi:formate hydrogenlyase subunit 4
MTTVLLAIVTAVIFPGLIVRMKCLLSGRKGPGILQPWKNIWVLMHKGSVISTTTSIIFHIAPAFYLSTVLCAILLLPFPGIPSLFTFEGDFVFLAYLLALGKFMFILSSMDTGSSFEGMGANREALYSMLVEPAFFIIFGTLALATGNTSMQDIFSHLQHGGYSSVIIIFMAVYLLVQIAMIENSRMPVDDPKTHLELTMIHEVMILDHSGFDLALIHTATILKFSLFGILIANFIIPQDAGLILQFILFFVLQILFALLIGVLESFRARKKIAKNPQFILTLTSIALIAFALVLLITFKRIL